MGGVIWLAVIAYIVFRCLKNSANNNKRIAANKPPMTNRSSQPVQMKRPVQSTPSARPKQKSAMTAPASQPRRTAAKPQNNSILEKAKQHAESQFNDDAVRSRKPTDLTSVPLGEEIVADKARNAHIHSEHNHESHNDELRNQHGIDDFDTYHLMDEVQDLIVKGYSGDLQFERDFVAEGMDMLGRMTLGE
ncbi:MAG: hypothetical protein PUD20_11980 [bacterium]|nr:hypothetical protein [bacterium]